MFFIAGYSPFLRYSKLLLFFLFLHDLTYRDPIQYLVTVPAGYNSRDIQAIGVKVYSIKKEFYELGLTSGKPILVEKSNTIT